MKRNATIFMLPFTLLLFATPAAIAQIAVGAGGGLEIGESLVPGAWLVGSGSFYRFPSESLSMFLDTAARAGWEQGEQSELTAAGSIEGAATYRVGSFTSRYTMSAYTEARTGGDPVYVQLGNEALFSLGSFDYSVFIEPEYVFALYEAPTSRIRGAAGASITVFETTVMTAGVDAFTSRTDRDIRDSGFETSVDATWYPAMPFSAQATLRYASSDSTRATVFGTEDLFYETYTLIGVDLLVSMTIGTSMTLEVSVPGHVRMQAHGAIADDELLDEREWRLRIAPVVAHAVRLSPSISISTDLSMVLRRSNSDYGALNSTVFGLSSTVEYQFR